MSDELLIPVERKLRDLLWASHACTGKYGDDGELQCGCFLPIIDFLRDSPEDIALKIPIHYAQLEKIRNKPLPTNEEIHIKIVDVVFGDLSVPDFREWLVEKFR